VYRYWVSLVCALIAPFGAAFAQAPAALKAAVVALADDPMLRESFERELVVKALEHDYDAVTSYDLVPDVDDVDSKRFRDTLTAQGVRIVLMVRPAAVGPGSSLAAVRDEIPAELLERMRTFAKQTSASASEDLIAVVHMAIYALEADKAELVSSGAVWLDEPAESREQGIVRLQDLIVANVDAARPAIRRRFGLPPLQ
jgi:hypothetical protein